MLERIPGYEIDVELARKTSFAIESKYRGYKVTRGLNECNKDLPRFGSRTFLDILRKRLEQQKVTYVLDIGAGKGYFLEQMKRDFGKQVSVHGISSFDYRVKSYPKSIDYRIGDAQHLGEVFQGENFDFIVSIFSFPYIADTVSVLKQAYELLSFNAGYIFIDKPSLDIDTSTSERLKKYWSDFGIESEFPSKHGEKHTDLVIRKNGFCPNELPTPFLYKPSFDHAYGTTSYYNSGRYYLSLKEQTPGI